MYKSIGRLMSILHRQSQIYVNYALKEYNISSAEYSFLLYLYRKDGATQDELSSYLYIDKAATARAIKSLEEKGYVKKAKDLSDKRFNRVQLTEKAIDCKSEIRRRVANWSRFLTEDLDQETENIVISALEKIAAKLECTDLKKLTEKL